MKKVTKTRFFISKRSAQAWFSKIIEEWKTWSVQNKTFLSPVMLFSDFYTLSYGTIEYKTVYDPEIEMDYLSLWVNKKILFHMLADPIKMKKKMLELEYYAQVNQIQLKPFHYNKNSSDSSESW